MYTNIQHGNVPSPSSSIRLDGLVFLEGMGGGLKMSTDCRGSRRNWRETDPIGGVGSPRVDGGGAVGGGGGGGGFPPGRNLGWNR